MYSAIYHRFSKTTITNAIYYRFSKQQQPTPSTGISTHHAAHCFTNPQWLILCVLCGNKFIIYRCLHWHTDSVPLCALYYVCAERYTPTASCKLNGEYLSCDIAEFVMIENGGKLEEDFLVSTLRSTSLVIIFLLCK